MVGVYFRNNYLKNTCFLDYSKMLSFVLAMEYGAGEVCYLCEMPG